MSGPDSCETAPTPENHGFHTTNPSPEDMSLSYEQLFDAKQDDDGPCYLPSYVPEEGEHDSESSTSSESVNGKAADANSEDGASEAQEFSGNEDDRLTSGAKSSWEPQSPIDVNGFECISHNMKDLDLKDESVSTEHRDGAHKEPSSESYPKNHVDAEDEDIKEHSSAGANSLPGVTSTDNGESNISEIQIESAAGNGHVEGYKSEGSSAVDSAPASAGGRELHMSGLAHEADLLKTDLIPGKQHQNEDDSSAAWRKHKKHFFILSHAGKPIYSRYGDEHKLAGFSATLQAIMSFVENGGDFIKYVQAGDHQVVFLVKGPVYLVSISSTDELLRSLRRQLDLLHGQLLLILTKSLEKCFVKNANFDLRPLLGGTENVFSSLIHSFSWNPASFLCSYTCLPLSHTARQAAGAALQDVADKDLLFALLLSDSKVISLVGAQKASLHPDDIFLLSNFVSSSESFRTTESFSPVCLPKYNAAAFLYAYIRYLDTDTCLILITKNSDAFFHLKDCRARVESFLMETHVLREISNSVARGGLRVEDLPGGDVFYGSVPRSTRMANKGDSKASSSTGSGIVQRPGVGGAAGLCHFIYRSIYLDQYVASEFSPPLQTPQAQKRLFRAYQRLYDSMHGAPAGSHQMQYRRDENHVLLAWSTADFEFFAAFDPLAEKSSAITVCNRVCQWIRDVENDFFFVGASPFNW